MRKSTVEIFINVKNFNNIFEYAQQALIRLSKGEKKYESVNLKKSK